MAIKKPGVLVGTPGEEYLQPARRKRIARVEEIAS
jgi:hypothetical protein